MKIGGGNAGHNGLRSITAHIGNEYHRVRIGIGHPGAKDAVAHYVLHDFAKVDTPGSIRCSMPWRTRRPISPRVIRPASCRKSRSRPAMTATPRQSPSRRPLQRPSGHRATPSAGERASKRAGALAENLKKWLAGRTDKE